MYVVSESHTFQAQWKKDPRYGNIMTGDECNLILCLALMMTSLLILIGFAVNRRRSR